MQKPEKYIINNQSEFLIISKLYYQYDNLKGKRYAFYKIIDNKIIIKLCYSKDYVTGYKLLSQNYNLIGPLKQVTNVYLLVRKYYDHCRSIQKLDEKIILKLKEKLLNCNRKISNQKYWFINKTIKYISDKYNVSQKEGNDLYTMLINNLRKDTYES